MATQTTKKTTKRKYTRPNNTKSSPLKKYAKGIFVLLVIVALMGAGYALGKYDSALLDLLGVSEKQTAIAKVNPSVKTSKTTKSMEDKKSSTSTQKRQEVNATLSQKTPSDSNQTKQNITPENQQTKSALLAYRGKKPKLVIIIDDVTSAKQLVQIRALPLKVTPSIFPPHAQSKSNHKLAQGLKHYMIHLPMQSGKVFDAQQGTLMTTDSSAKIQARVKELRTWFPTARYVNSHTGSVFTSNYEAMKNLYEALRKEGFVFVDSRTTNHSVVPRIAHEFKDAYVARDVFIDNKQNIASIHTQLKQAIKEAKKNGYAIVIGHPYKVTMRALTDTKGLLDEVEVVYIDAIYRKHD